MAQPSSTLDVRVLRLGALRDVAATARTLRGRGARVEHRELPGARTARRLCSSFEGVKQKGFPCPAFIRPGRQAPPCRVATDRRFSRSTRRAAHRFPRTRGSSCAAPSTERAMGFGPHAPSRLARPGGRSRKPPVGDREVAKTKAWSYGEGIAVSLDLAEQSEGASRQLELYRGE